MASDTPATGTGLRIGYARVSTDDQRLDLQRDALQAAGCARLFEDTISGARAERPGLAQALSHLRPGDTLVVWKLDRLGRTVHGLVAFMAELQARGIQFRSLKDAIDTGTPAGRFFFHVMAALAEMERGLIRERTRAGLAAARARGRLGGRKPLMDARRLDTARRLLRDESLSMQEIAARVGVSRSTLYRALGRAKGRG